METVEHFDIIVIGAGMSGLAAGIRLALFGKKVLILEKHNNIGGLNSFYSIQNHKYDVGLHAVTNHQNINSPSNTTLSKVLRQLRLPKDAFQLSPQKRSQILFPHAKLIFTNDISVLESSIHQTFPSQIDAFRKLCTQIKADFSAPKPHMFLTPSKDVLRTFLSDELLIEMLSLPVLTYGSACEHDFSWAQFAYLFQSIYLEGFGRPTEGVRLILRLLREHFKALGGQRKMKANVKEILTRNDSAIGVVLDSGETLLADAVFSSAGLPETFSLCNHPATQAASIQKSKITFFEALLNFNPAVTHFNSEDTILFYNRQNTVNYSCPDRIHTDLGVLCIPSNYQDYPSDAPGILRLATLANYDYWNSLDASAYQQQKQLALNELKQIATHYLRFDSTFDASVSAIDTFTPKTIERFTGHHNGVVYGSATKAFDGLTPIKNLFIIGADQGLLGIVGSMLSGVTIANKVLSK